MKPEMGAAVQSPQIDNSVTAILNCNLRSKIVVRIERKPALHKPQFTLQLNYVLNCINRSS